MQSENDSAFVVPFSISKESAWKCALKYLCEQETTPVDIVCNSRVFSVVKEYYPVEQLEINWSAKWNAISIYIRRWTEQHPYLAQEIRYYDHFGEWHDSPGFDYIDPKTGKWKSGALHPIKSRTRTYSGETGTKPWEPREVTVEKIENIECEEETGRERTRGELTGWNVYTHTAGYPLPLANPVRLRESTKMLFIEDAVKDATIVGQSQPFSKSECNSSLYDSEKCAQKLCEQRVPGESHIDFNVKFTPLEDTRPCTWYYPVYHIVYEYKEQQYECYVSGYEESLVSGNVTPQDASIETIKQQYDNQISVLEDKRKQERKNFWLIIVKAWVAGGIVVTLLTVFGIDNLFLQMVIVIASIVVAVRLCKAKNKELKDIRIEITKVKGEKDNLIPKRQAMKKKLLDIILDDTCSENEKATKCNGILNAQV